MALSSSRRYTTVDRVLIQIDSAWQTLAGRPRSRRESPASGVENTAPLTKEERRISQGCMRVNHAGEVCAQALYEGQMCVARDPAIRTLLAEACEEEKDHLAWTQDRLRALGTHRSYFNVFWYANAFLIGVVAGCCGDRWSLGFVEETERQVEAHLVGHLTRLPAADCRSRAVVAQMRDDEVEHGASAGAAGAASLPRWVCGLMQLQAQVMIRLAYWF